MTRNKRGELVQPTQSCPFILPSPELEHTMVAMKYPSHTSSPPVLSLENLEIQMEKILSTISESAKQLY